MIIYKIREHRKKAGLTQDQLANVVGVRRETIIRLEKGLYNPSLELSYKICAALKCDIIDTFVYMPEHSTEEPEHSTEEHEHSTEEHEHSSKESKEIKEYKLDMPSDFDELYLYKDIYDSEYEEFKTYCIKKYHADISEKRFLEPNKPLYNIWYNKYLDKYFL